MPLTAVTRSVRSWIVTTTELTAPVTRPSTTTVFPVPEKLSTDTAPGSQVGKAPGSPELPPAEYVSPATSQLSWVPGP